MSSASVGKTRCQLFAPYPARDKWPWDSVLVPSVSPRARACPSGSHCLRREQDGEQPVTLAGLRYGGPQASPRMRNSTSRTQGGFYRVSRVSSQHPARPRCSWEGPLVQLGASEGVLQMERNGGNPAPLHRGRASVQIHRHLNLEPELICTLKD